MMNFELAGNQLTVHQKQILRMIIKTLKLPNIKQPTDLTDLILQDKVLDKDADYPFHVAMNLDEDFGVSPWRDPKLKEKLRRLNEIANPTALEFYDEKYPQKFYQNEWVVTSGKLKGTKITRPSEQLLGDSVYGAALCFYGRHANNIPSISVPSGADPFIEQAYEFYVDAAFNEGYFRKWSIPIFVDSNGMWNALTPTNEIVDIQEFQRNLMQQSQKEQEAYQFDDHDDWDLER